MLPRQHPSDALLRLARLQADALSIEQVQGFGLGEKAVARLIREGHWQRMSIGLILTRPTEPDWNAWAWGGVLMGGDRARLGGQAAGHLWGLTAEPSRLDVLVPLQRELKQRACWRFIRERPGLRLPSRSSPPRTSIEDTVLDLCQNSDERTVIGLITMAVQQRLSHPSRLRRRMEQRGRIRHRRLIADLLREVSDGSESPLEFYYVKDVERAHGLPAGERQHRSAQGHVHDVRYERFRTVVELDGRLGHEGMGRFRDMRRDNVGVLRGDVTLRYGWVDVRARRCRVAWQVGSVLKGRGWDEMPQRCPTCRSVPVDELGVP